MNRFWVNVEDNTFNNMGETQEYSEFTSHTTSSINIKSSKIKDFSVMSYNVLSDHLARKNKHLYSVPFSHLDWKKRERLVVKEIISSNCDIICLQEVEERDFKWGYMSIEMKKAGFVGHYFKRRGDAQVDGCAMF